MLANAIDGYMPAWTCALSVAAARTRAQVAAKGTASQDAAARQTWDEIKLGPGGRCMS